MASEAQKRSRLAVLFFIGCVLLHYPVLSLFSSAYKEKFGIPLLFAYVFAIWALLIVVTFVTVRNRRRRGPSSDKVD